MVDWTHGTGYWHLPDRRVYTMVCLIKLLSCHCGGLTGHHKDYAKGPSVTGWAEGGRIWRGWIGQ